MVIGVKQTCMQCLKIAHYDQEKSDYRFGKGHGKLRAENDVLINRRTRSSNLLRPSKFEDDEEPDPFVAFIGKTQRMNQGTWVAIRSSWIINW